MVDGYRVEVNLENNPNVITYKIPTKIVGTEVLWERDVKKIKFDRYWDSHGKKVYWEDDHPCWKCGPCHVRIDVEKRIYYEDMEDEIWRMYINGKEVKGGIQGYHYLPKSGLLKIDAPFGWG